MTTSAPSSGHPGLGRSSSHASFFPRDDDGEEESSPSAALASMALDGAPREQHRFGALPQQQQQPQRPEPQKENDVGALVAKAKKAAASLWTILHAQNCRHPPGACPHPSCPDTQLLLAHVKSCPAGPGFPCPAHHRGCHEARKLLAHYRRCKDLRTKRVGHGRRNGMPPAQSCLVCSLMARYAKSVADRTHGKASSSSPSDVASLLSRSAEGKFAFCCPAVEGGASGNQGNNQGMPRRTSFQLMPPPPRRRPHPQASLPNESFGFGSPPNPSALSDLSRLGRSVDSSVRVPFPALHRGHEPMGEEEELVIPGLTTSPVRRRAGSCDERDARGAAPPALVGSDRAEPNEREDAAGSSPGRPRAASCGSNARGQRGHHHSPSSAASGCETIAEEGPEGVFDMD
ncbi:hypothetical protein ACHAXT_010830 [Thalassiosira profunda]